MILYILLALVCTMVGAAFGFLLGASWWWIKFQLQYRMYAKLAAKINRTCDLIEEALERMYQAAEEAEEMTGMLEAECSKQQPLPR